MLDSLKGGICIQCEGHRLSKVLRALGGGQKKQTFFSLYCWSVQIFQMAEIRTDLIVTDASFCSAVTGSSLLLINIPLLDSLWFCFETQQLKQPASCKTQSSRKLSGLNGGSASKHQREETGFECEGWLRPSFLLSSTFQWRFVFALANAYICMEMRLQGSLGVSAKTLNSWEPWISNFFETWGPESQNSTFILSKFDVNNMDCHSNSMSHVSSCSCRSVGALEFVTVCVFSVAVLQALHTQLQQHFFVQCRAVMSLTWTRHQWGLNSPLWHHEGLIFTTVSLDTLHKKWALSIYGEI